MATRGELLTTRIVKWLTERHGVGTTKYNDGAAPLTIGSLPPRERLIDDDDEEGAARAASLATMFFALALDHEHFGELPKPEIKLLSPDPMTVGEKYGMQVDG